MKLWLVAVGHRQPAWADHAYDEFARRFPPELKLRLKAVKAESRGGKSAEQLKQAEAMRIEAALPKGVRRIVLDETGSRITTVQLSERLQSWMAGGGDVALLIGGPDGLAESLKATADERLRLSDLTLPHAFARILLAEALYRAWTVMTGHPYHRE